MNIPLIVLAAGISSRMKAAARDAVSADLAAQAAALQKGMIGIGPGGRPLLDYLLYNAKQAGIREAILVIGESDESIRKVYGSLECGNPYHGLSISYAVQPIPPGRTKPLGTADALLRALDTLRHSVSSHALVCNSDNMYSSEAMQALLALPKVGGWIDYDMDALCYPPERIARFGIPVKDENGYLLRILEKPSVEELGRLNTSIGTLRVSMNIWRVPVRLLMPFLRDCPVNAERDEKELPAAISLMARAHPRSMRGIPWSEHVPDLTSPADFDDMRDFLSRNYTDLNW